MAGYFQLPPLFGYCFLAEVSWNDFTSSPFESEKLIEMTMPALTCRCAVRTKELNVGVAEINAVESKARQGLTTMARESWVQML